MTGRQMLGGSDSAACPAELIAAQPIQASRSSSCLNRKMTWARFTTRYDATLYTS
jgi:hypothetical protein